MEDPFSLRDAVKKQTAEHVEFVGCIEKMSFLISSTGNHISALLGQAMRRTMRPICHALAIPEEKSGVKPPHSKIFAVESSPKIALTGTG